MPGRCLQLMTTMREEESSSLSTAGLVISMTLDMAVGVLGSW